jgi:hypothetical protein
VNRHEELTWLESRLQELHRRTSAPKALAVVLPVAEGRSDVVAEFLAEGPPFDPEAVGLERHQVFATDREIIFVFESDEGMEAFERILNENELWDILPAWEHNLAGEPRIAERLYHWPDEA